MTASIYVPFAVCLFLAVSAPLCRRLPPGPGAWMVVTGAFTRAVGTMWALALLAASLVDDIPALDGEGQFGLPVSDAISAAALVLLGWAGARVAGEMRAQRQLRRRLQAIGELPGSDLVFLPDPAARAFVVPGRPGRIVVTDTMLRSLTVAQRRVLLAHERTHLKAHHPIALALAHLAVAANPVLIPAVRSAAFLIERDADEAAARSVGDRLLAAEALAAAALATAETSVPPSTAPNFSGVSVLDRLAALEAAPRPGHRAALAPIAAAIVVGLGAGLDATIDFAALVDRLLDH